MLKECQQITFVMLNGFCLLRNPPPPPPPPPWLAHISLLTGTNGKPLAAIGKFPSVVGKLMIGKILATKIKKIQFSITEINTEIKTTATAVIKNELKYFLMSEGNTCIAEPKLEVLPFIWFSKGLV